MSKIDNESYYITYSWMVKGLSLKGFDLDVFAIIYSYSEKGEFFGSLSYLEEMTGATRKTVIKSLNLLCEKEYVIKSEFEYNKVRRVSYKSVGNIKEIASVKIPLPQCKIYTTPSGENTLPLVENLHYPSGEIPPNSKSIIKEKTKTLNPRPQNDEDDLKNSSFLKKNGGLEVVENNRTATAPQTGARQTSAVVDKLFCDSDLADFETFKEYVQTVLEFAHAGYYFTRISTWQTKEGFPMRSNWYSVVSSWIMDDFRKGKLITNEHKGYEQQHNPEYKSDAQIEYERMRDEYLSSI